MGAARAVQAEFVDVHLDAPELGPAVNVGRLFHRRGRGGSAFSFAYNPDWLRSGSAFTLDPRLELYTGEQFATSASETFGIFLDSAPDRWGRLLLDRREALAASEEKRTARSLSEWDYLLGVGDESRMGALRFRRDEKSAFLDDRVPGVPAATSLAELESISLALEQKDAEDSSAYRHWLTMLIAPGTSLGGSRPKANFRDRDGSLWIAKFPSREDRRDIGAWEKLLHDLARKCEIDVPECRLARFKSAHHTFCSKRFDRNLTTRRFFVSAMTLLERRDGDGGSYLEIAEFIQNYGARGHIESDLQQLYRRVIFNALVGNTDDHLRNHGFIRAPSGWRLAPAYDLNPNPAKHTHALRFDDTSDVPDLGVIRQTAPFYRVDKSAAERLVARLRAVTAEWKCLAKAAKIASSEISGIESAFRQSNY